MRTGITKVYFVNSLGGKTPAACNRKTGVCLIDKNWWKSLTKEARLFILLHEQEHILQDTSDELAVDAVAHIKYLNLGYKITPAIHALTRVLTYDNNEHALRTFLQIERSKQYDYSVRGNKKIKF